MVRLLLLLLSFPVLADTVQIADSTGRPLPVNSTTANGVPVAVVNQLACEDATNGVCKVEHQYAYAQDDADLVVKATPGFVHAFSCYPEDAAATAGSVVLRDATAAGGGTVIWQEFFAAAAYAGVNRILDVVMPTGIVIDFTTTDDVFCIVSYR